MIARRRRFPHLDRLRSFVSREFVLLASIGVFTASLWLFVAITDEVQEKEPHGTEKQMMLALRTHDDPWQPIGPRWIKQASIDITALGSAPVLTLITGLVAGYLLLDRKSGSAAFLLCATVGGTALSHWLKFFFNRDRPEVVPHLAEFSNSSYPSGHSMLSTVVYLTLAVVVAQTLPTRRGKVYVIAAAVFLAFLVGLSRVIIGVHYPTDVLAGWTAGTAWALLCWLFAVWLKRRGYVVDRPHPKTHLTT
jgi:undecaprenyl-diphosphatase